MKNFRIPALTVLVSCIIYFSGCTNGEKKEATSTDKTTTVTEKTVTNNKSCDLKTAMRKLWEDHITWTRNVIICLVDNAPGTKEAVDRLQKNQDDIGDAVKSYYGNDAGKKLADLLHEHISISADVVNSAKKNDKAGLDAAQKKWNDNADSIASFLIKANPDWKLDDMKMMMHDHLKYTTDEAVARIKKDYKADVAAYDKVHDEILKMADMLSDGIVKQFPDKF
jgi:hypothetical protein